MPFGLSDTPPHFQSFMNSILFKKFNKRVYLDDGCNSIPKLTKTLLPLYSCLTNYNQNLIDKHFDKCIKNLEFYPCSPSSNILNGQNQKIVDNRRLRYLKRLQLYKIRAIYLKGTKNDLLNWLSRNLLPNQSIKVDKPCEVSHKVSTVKQLFNKNLKESEFTGAEAQQIDKTLQGSLSGIILGSYKRLIIQKLKKTFLLNGSSLNIIRRSEGSFSNTNSLVHNALELRIKRVKANKFTDLEQLMILFDVDVNALLRMNEIKPKKVVGQIMASFIEDADKSIFKNEENNFLHAKILNENNDFFPVLISGTVLKLNKIIISDRASTDNDYTMYGRKLYNDGGILVESTYSFDIVEPDNLLYGQPLLPNPENDNEYENQLENPIIQHIINNIN
ncbi:hypothetical protein BCR32DRAFT_287820 [Anaeromyces robustus]|uniref:Uncharacterized protein n=1 Tax=Anaeromyces robustus TaxID=1754192 RepID=A0A1Y1VQ22_9FUNG|nr:hypothetical protein BCR32DRAFT_287820 [Anaeromyces robustus]|eukprot:ORX63369.1 hypothetical protein BCR32DRAFT_287820 [Anaeromyces robustus]